MPTFRNPDISASYIIEPTLLFGGNNQCLNPRVGIPLYGPYSLHTPRHKREVHVGFIGPAQSVANVQEYLRKCCKGINGEGYHFPFPGCDNETGYGFNLIISDSINEKITERDRDRILEKGLRQKDRFELALNLIIGKLELLCGKDHPLDYVVVVLPDDLAKIIRAADYKENGVSIHRDFRRAFKARAMVLKKPTQIILESTTGLTSFKRQLDKDSTRAWNLFTGMYFKVGGLPWAPFGLKPSSCYVGVSFYRPLGEASIVQASVARAFNEHGDGLVLRGQEFEWDEDEKGRAPHLPRQYAANLMANVLELYERECNHLPKRVVVHKSSRFLPDERNGFKEGLAKVAEHDLVSLSPSRGVRLLRQGKYPPLRGTCLSIGDEKYLYTTGYIPAIKAYPHGHVPTPLGIVDHVGDTPIDQIMNEILLLSKMNWNAANMDGFYPITMQFARGVGDILRELPNGVSAESKYLYYM